MQRIGVFICHCGINIASTVDMNKVVDHVKYLPDVVVAESYTYMCSEPGQELIRENIEKYGLNKIVVASCSPTMHEITFREVLKSAGLNPFCFEMANIREQCSWVHPEKEMSTDKAKAILSAAVSRVSLLEPLEERTVTVIPSVLVVGAGIAGIQASLDIANAGYKVYLVEKEASIGGRMAQLDKTFPTLDCAACTLTPKMSEVGRHPNIELLAYSEVKEVEGFVGNFKAKITKKPTFVDWEKCNGCDDCVAMCPVDLRDEFNAGLGFRKAIFRLFPQAVPNKFLIDSRGVPPCRIACPAGVNAQGYIALIKSKKYKEALALERRDNPFPSVCGRVCTHPCESECKRSECDEPLAIASLKRFIADYKGEPEEPKEIEKREERIAIVGSGPSGLSCGYFLALKGYNVTVYEEMEEPGGMLRYGIPRFRLPLESLMKDIQYIEKCGVEIRTHSKVEDIDALNEEYDAVYVAIGAYRELMMGIAGEELKGVLSCIEFLKNINKNEKVEIGKRIAVIGGGNAALDAARSARRLGAEVTILYRRSRQEMPANAEEIEAAIEEGVKIEYLSQPVKFLGENGIVSGVELVRMELGDLDASGRRRPIPISGSETSIVVDNVILAIGQKPESDWLKKDLEITKWGTIKIDESTLCTVKEGIFAGGDAVRGPSTVIEAIADGKKAALVINAYISKEELITEEIRNPVTEFPRPLSDVKKARQRIATVSQEKRVNSFIEVETGFSEEQALEEAERCLNCGGCSECMECVKSCDKDAIEYGMLEEELEIECGAIIVSTGYDPFDAVEKKEYGYGEYRNVITGLELERLLSSSGPTVGEVLVDGKSPKKIVFIHCVGSRDQSVGNEYCSRICCMFIAKQAHLIKERIPKAEVTVLYMDVRAFGKGFEEFYDRVRNEGIIYRRCNPSEVYKKGEKLIVMAEDTLLGEPVDIEADLVVLGTGLVPKKETEEIRNILKLSRSSDGFLLEAHPKLRPVDTVVDGVFLGGCCQGPKDIPDTIAQAKGAASSVMSMITRGYVVVEPVVASIDDITCSGCGICEAVCEYGALSLDPIKKVMICNEVLCKGCSACSSACPSNAIILKHYTPKQLFAQIESILK